MPFDVDVHNREAWDRLVEAGDRWTVPVDAEAVAAARDGAWSIVLTPVRPIPRSWFPPLEGARTLCLAGGGGQQGPILAAAGARVTVLDASVRQLGQDRAVARREGLTIGLARGDMRTLPFANGAFDLVVHPCSNCFVSSVRPVWREAARVLAPGGVLLAGFLDPAVFLFDHERAEAGELVVRHRLPYSDVASLPDEELRRLVEAGEPLVFSHSLEDLLGGQLEAGLVLTAMAQDGWLGETVAEYLPPFLLTRAVKPAVSPDV